MRRMITSKQAESTRILSGITEGSQYYEEPILPNSMIFDEVDWDNSEIEYTGNGKGTASLLLNATNVPEHFMAYDDDEEAPCGSWYLNLSGLPETITDTDKLIEFIKQGGLKEEYLEESELQEWDIGYFYSDGVAAFIEPQEEEFNLTTLILVGSILVATLPTPKLSVNGDMNVTKDLKVSQDMEVKRILTVNSIKSAPGVAMGVTVNNNLKVTGNVNVNGWIAGKEQTWGYTMAESIDEDNNYSANGSATFGNGQKGELKIMARVDDSGNMIVADFEFNQTAVNSQEVQFTYPIRYYDANENWHWGHLIVGGSLVGLDKKSHLFAYILGDNNTPLTLVLIDNADYTKSTYGVKIEVLPH